MAPSHLRGRPPTGPHLHVLQHGNLVDEDLVKVLAHPEDRVLAVGVEVVALLAVGLAHQVVEADPHLAFVPGDQKQVLGRHIVPLKVVELLPRALRAARLERLAPAMPKGARTSLERRTQGGFSRRATNWIMKSGAGGGGEGVRRTGDAGRRGSRGRGRAGGPRAGTHRGYPARAT